MEACLRGGSEGTQVTDISILSCILAGLEPLASWKFLTCFGGAASLHRAICVAGPGSAAHDLRHALQVVAVRAVLLQPAIAVGNAYP